MAVFYWGSLIAMILCGGVSLYGIIILIKNWKIVNPDKRTVTIMGIAGLLSTSIVCFIVFTIVGIFYEPFSQPDPPDAWKIKDNKTMAYVMMQNFVKENLQSPGTAKFEWITESDCEITKDGFDYTITSWVDSQNAFGAIVRTQFSGVLRQVDKDNWLLLILSMDDQRAYIDWDWVRENNMGKINVDKFIFNFKTLMNYFVWEDAERYVAIDYNTDPIDIRTKEIGQYIIKIYSDASGYINKAMFSYVSNDTQYQNDMSHKVFSAFINAIEFFNTENETLEIVEELYDRRKEVTVSYLGNKYSKNIDYPNFSYSVEIYN